MGRSERGSQTDQPSIVLRAASLDDMSFIRGHIEKFLLDDEDLNYRQFIVAAEGDEIVGFGRIRQHKKVYELGGVGVIESSREQGIGRMIVERLISIFPTDDVYITTDIPEYFEKLGFRKIEPAPQELIEKIERVCKTKCRKEAVAMLYKRERKTDHVIPIPE
jgi:N-acetylglutamate synthase-like GNAT family acetyltransferase